MEGQVIDEEAMSKIMAGLDLLAAPVGDGGFGDEQAMRITCWWRSWAGGSARFCMLDPDPLQPLCSTTAPREAFETRRRWSPGCVPTDQDRRRPEHRLGRCRGRRDHQGPAGLGREAGPPSTAHRETPKYLFLAVTRTATVTARTQRDVAAPADPAGAATGCTRWRRASGRLRPDPRFPHTVATGLLNHGVPLHVCNGTWGM